MQPLTTLSDSDEVSVVSLTWPEWSGPCPQPPRSDAPAIPMKQTMFLMFLSVELGLEGFWAFADLVATMSAAESRRKKIAWS
jgi:hypothetical protein